MKKISQKIAKPKKISVVFICTGNTCRSPVAERVFKHQLKKARKLNKFKVASAGLSAEAGAPMSALSAQVLKEAGIMHANHKSRPLTDKIIKSADYFICMTQGHKLAMRGLSPQIYTVAEITNGGDVSDPWGGTYEEYKRMFDYVVYAMPEIESFIAAHSAQRRGVE